MTSCFSNRFSLIVEWLSYLLCLNFSRINFLSQKHFANTTTIPQSVRNDLRKTTSLPDEQLVFKFDCILQERATYDELMGALDGNSMNSRFSLQIAKLDLLCLGKSNIIKLLEKLEKNVSLIASEILL